MTAPRVTHGGAIWQDDGRTGRTYGSGVFVAAPGGAAGDVTISDHGPAVAELRRLPDGDAYLVSATDRRAFVPDPANPGDWTLGDPATSGARGWIADPANAGDVILGTGAIVAWLTETPGGVDTFFVRLTAPTVPVLRIGDDFVVT